MNLHEFIKKECINFDAENIRSAINKLLKDKYFLYNILTKEYITLKPEDNSFINVLVDMFHDHGLRHIIVKK